MAHLGLFPFLSEIKSKLDEYVEIIDLTPNIVLVAEPELSQLVSLALIEASFLDNGVLYQRKLVESIEDFTSNYDDLTILFTENSENINSVLTISSKEVAVNLGQNENTRIGKLDKVGMAGCLALTLGAGKRVNQMLPLILAGNWLNSNLDFTYDPIFTKLRDSLVKKGEISVVTLPEVPEPDMLELPGIDSVQLNLLKTEWNSIGLDEQSKRLSKIAQPLLLTSMGVARLEELIWHRVIKSDWNLDLASQCSKSQRDIKSSSKKLVTANRLIDDIIRFGKLS